MAGEERFMAGAERRVAGTQHFMAAGERRMAGAKRRGDAPGWHGTGPCPDPCVRREHNHWSAHPPPQRTSATHEYATLATRRA